MSIYFFYRIVSYQHQSSARIKRMDAHQLKRNQSCPCHSHLNRQSILQYYYLWSVVQDLQVTVFQFPKGYTKDVLYHVSPLLKRTQSVRQRQGLGFVTARPNCTSTTRTSKPEKKSSPSRPGKDSWNIQSQTAKLSMFLSNWRRKITHAMHPHTNTTSDWIKLAPVQESKHKHRTFHRTRP